MLDKTLRLIIINFNENITEGEQSKAKQYRCRELKLA